MFFPLLKIQDGMLIMARTLRRSNGSVTALALGNLSGGSESGTRKLRGPSPGRQRRAWVKVRPCQESSGPD